LAVDSDTLRQGAARRRQAPLDILHLAAPCRNVPVTFTLDRIVDRPGPSEYHLAMQLATGKVVNGKVVVEGLDLPEGATVIVLTRDNAPPVKLSPEDEAELLEALDEADVEEGISAEELFARLQRFC
jgi:hypothetical protein